MTTFDRRHRGRAIRRARRDREAGIVTVPILPDTAGFSRSLALAVARTVMPATEALRVLGRIAGLSTAEMRTVRRHLRPNRPLLHNGRKPR